MKQHLKIVWRCDLYTLQIFYPDLPLIKPTKGNVYSSAESKHFFVFSAPAAHVETQPNDWSSLPVYLAADLLVQLLGWLGWMTYWLPSPPLCLSLSVWTYTPVHLEGAWELTGQGYNRYLTWTLDRRDMSIKSITVTEMRKYIYDRGLYAVSIHFNPRAL